MPQEDTQKKHEDQGAQGLQQYLRYGTLKYNLTTPYSQGSDDWLVTYTDMVTLLITLFIVMIAHSTFEKKEGGLVPLLFENYATTDGLKSNIGDQAHMSQGDVIYLGDFPEPEEMAEHTKNHKQKMGSSSPDLEKVKRVDDLRELMWKVDMDDSVEINKISGDIEVRINENILFPTAQADLFSKGQDILAGMLPILHDGNFEIIVEGHTDNIPIATRQYPSNWELSAARALSVVHYLEKHGISPQRLQAIAYGETRPLSSNDKPEERRKNRGVQIILR